MPSTFFLTDTITSGTAIGAGATINGLDIVGLEISAGWDAAAVTLSQSTDGTTWHDVFDSTGTEISYAVSAARYVTIAPATLSGVQYLRIRSGTSGVPVNQTANRTVVWHCRNFGR